jgi:hypothetical protein
MWKNKERSVDWGGVFGLSIIKHVTLQKIVAHDFHHKKISFLQNVTKALRLGRILWLKALRGFSPQANYTDRATAACRRS